MCPNWWNFHPKLIFCSILWGKCESNKILKSHSIALVNALDLTPFNLCSLLWSIRAVFWLVTFWLLNVLHAFTLGESWTKFPRSLVTRARSTAWNKVEAGRSKHLNIDHHAALEQTRGWRPQTKLRLSSFTPYIYCFSLSFLAGYSAQKTKSIRTSRKSFKKKEQEIGIAMRLFLFPILKAITSSEQW